MLLLKKENRKKTKQSETSFSQILIQSFQIVCALYFSFTETAILGVWTKAHLQFVQNRRGGCNLAYQGFLYTTERKYTSTTNWVCNKNSNLRLKCPARCVTAGESAIKLSKKLHNHDVVYRINLDSERDIDLATIIEIE